MLGGSSKAPTSLQWFLTGTDRQSILHGSVARQCAKPVSASLYITAAITDACPGLICLFNRQEGMQELESCHADEHVVKTLHSQLHTLQQ